MRRLAGDCDRVIARPAARMRQRAVGQRAGFVGQRGIFAARQFLDQRTAGKTAGFLVRIDHHVVSHARRACHRFEGLQRVEDDIQPAFHIGGAGPVDRLVVEPADLLERMIFGEDGIHVPRQHEAPLRFRAHAQHHMPAMRLLELAALRRDRGDRGGFDQIDVAGQGAEGIGEDPRHPVQPGDIAGARVDCRPFLHLAQHRVAIDCVEQRLGGGIRFHVQRP